jgi:hypothetical protein
MRDRDEHVFSTDVCGSEVEDYRHIFDSLLFETFALLNFIRCAGSQMLRWMPVY